MSYQKGRAADWKKRRKRMRRRASWLVLPGECAYKGAEQQPESRYAG
jgi:hypothetical protein